jgi:isopenicillin-N N-acyltransferase like protein
MRQLLSTTFLFLLVPVVAAQTPPSFPPGKHGKGELVHLHGFPVLTVRGTPEEIGEQFGVLAVKNAPGIQPLLEQFLKDVNLENGYPALKLVARQLKKNYPKDHLVEMETAAKAGGHELDLLLFANGFYDLANSMGCATVVVEPSRSRAEGPLFGRNFDWVASKGIDRHTLMVVFRPEGKRAFATITISPILGCISGINEDGLAVTINEIHRHQSKDKPQFNWKGTPTMALFRRVLEECKTVNEAEEFVKKSDRTTTCCMTLCDTTSGAVFEMTPKTVVVRSSVNSLCCCTNHFCSDELGLGQSCQRFAMLKPLLQASEKLGVEEIFAQLDKVNQGNKTLQTMVFEPKALILHLKCGDTVTSASKKDAMKFDLGKLFGKR